MATAPAHNPPRRHRAESCASSAPVIGEHTRRNMFRSAHGVEGQERPKSARFLLSKTHGVWRHRAARPLPARPRPA
eukprot:6894409-Prymnesium_polylepis.1